MIPWHNEGMRQFLMLWLAAGILNAPIWGAHFRSLKGAFYGLLAGCSGVFGSLVMGFFLFARWYDARQLSRKA